MGAGTVSGTKSCGESPYERGEEFEEGRFLDSSRRLSQVETPAKIRRHRDEKFDMSQGEKGCSDAKMDR